MNDFNSHSGNATAIDVSVDMGLRDGEVYEKGDKMIYQQH
jgi:hypothetical protein